MTEGFKGNNIFDKEMVQDDGQGEKKPDKHYSEKGGHLLRGQFYRLQRELQKALPDFYARNISNLVQGEKSWLIRRDMRRIPQDGRR